MARASLQRRGNGQAAVPGTEGDIFGRFFRNAGGIMLAALEKSIERHDKALRELFIATYWTVLPQGKGRAAAAEKAQSASEKYRRAVGEMFANSLDALAWGESVPVIGAMTDRGLSGFFAKTAAEEKLGNPAVVSLAMRQARKLIVGIVEEEEFKANIYAGLVADESGKFRTVYCGPGSGEKPRMQHLQMLTAEGREALAGIPV